MKTPKIIIKKNSFLEILKVDPTMITNDHIKKELIEAIELAGKMSEIALRNFEEILEKWKTSHDAVLYFGELLKVRHIKIIRKRIRRINRWLHKRKLKIRLLSQNKAAKKTLIGQNYGSFLSPRRFVLFPRWFKQDKNEKASVIIHELMHEWFDDQKITRHGKTRKVYGKNAARALAKENPKKARRSAENYEQYCEQVWRKEVYA